MSGETNKRATIPRRELGDYLETPPGARQFYAGRFEEITARLPNRLRPHRHPYFEVFWLAGDGVHSNDFREYPISTPRLIFVSPGQVHHWQRGETLRGVSLCFTQEFFDGDAPPPSPLLRHHFWYPQDCPPVLDLPGPAAEEIHARCLEIEREFVSQPSRWEDMLRALLRTLLIRAQRLYEAQHPQMGATRRHTLVRDFRLALEARFATVQTVQGYAELLGVSADHLGRAFREHTGRAVAEVMRERVVLEAKRLLAHTTMNVAEVAYALSFDDPAYFCRYFRRISGQSPGAFRRDLMV